MVEHPAYIKRHASIGAASIWRLPEMLRIMCLDIAELHLVHQSDHGMKAYKPTFFCAGRLSCFKQCLLKFKQPTPRSEIVALSGRNDDGTFKAAVGKEYPDLLCRAIAESFGSFAQGLEKCFLPPNNHSFGVDFLDYAKHFVIFIDSSPDTFGDDFVDNGELPLLQLPKL